ncbi:T9SS type A sorting domain-containing protein [Tenacibaculum sp. A30]|uniref:T9SS type A sorting domain-containing protein n=1 Tax=Tenacibaculum sp. A30 TaxID=3442644 RepID=UPI003EBAED0E
MKHYYNLLLTVMLSIFCTLQSLAQNTGDIAFIAFNTDGDDDFAIVVLNDIPAKTTIFFSDDELNGAGGFVDFNEGNLEWNTGGAVISAGTVVTFTDTDSSINPGFGSSIGSLSSAGAGGTLNLAASGDALFAYLGTVEAPTIFLAGIQNEAGNYGDLTGSGLTEGSTFINLFETGNPDGGKYIGPRTGLGAYSAYLTEIANITNWLIDIDNGENLLPLDNTAFKVTPIWTGATNNDWNTASNWDYNVVPPNNADITIPSGLENYPTASSALTFNSLTINSGASFIPQSTVTGTVTYKRSLPTTLWYLVSPPVAGETIEDIIANHTLASGNGGNLGLAPYSNITGSAWLYVQSGNTGTITNGTGLSIKLATPGEVSISGTANTSNIAKAISTGSRTNYNLVGNPYTAYINSASFTASNSSILTSETIWLWNGTQYTTRNAVNPIEIAPGQAFFVEAAASNNVIFAFSNQSHQNSDTFMKQEPIPSIELSVNNNEIKRSTQVFYVSGKTTGYDRSYDSKMFGEDTSGLAVFTELLTNNQGKQLAIQTLPNNDYEKMIIPIGLRANAGEEITFSVNFENLPDNLKVYLEDKNNNTFINLSEKNYTTTLSKNSNSTGQFYLHTSAKNLNLNLPNETKGIELFKAKNSQVIIVKGLQNQKATLKMFSLSGKQVFNTTFNSNGYTEISTPKLASGVYLVELVSDSIKTNAKIILD